MIVLFFVVFFTIDNLIAQSSFSIIDLEEKQKFDTSFLNNPNRLFLLNGSVYVFDIYGDRPFIKFDSTGKYNYSFGGWGQGPGEMGESTTQFVGAIDNIILIHNHNRRKISCFNLNGKFQKQLEIPSTSYVSAALTSKNTLVLLDYFSDSFAVGYHVAEDISITNKKAIPVGQYEELPELENCRNNFLLKQGPICTDNEGNVFIGFQFSSLIVGFDDKGNNFFKTSEPENIPIPEVVAKAGVYKAPDVGKHPEINVSLAVDEKYVYAVYSGTQPTLLNFIFTLDELFQGEIVRVYDKKTSDYLWSFELPYPVRDIKVTEDSIFLLSVDPEPALIKYKKPMELR